MDAAAVLNHPKVAALRHRLSALRAEGAIRELVPEADEVGPYVNLVLQGGGTLGIAHVGVVHALETLGVRIAGVAGTSAGAIAALLIASARTGDPRQRYSLDLLDVLGSMPSDEFIDGPYLVRRLVKELLLDRSINPLELAIPAFGTARHLAATGGINPGDRFQEWLQSTLGSRFGIRTIDDLRTRLSVWIDKALAELPQGIRHGAPSAFDSLQMIATGLPHGLKVTFPAEHEIFALHPQTESPAIFARASMSIPFFFRPLELPLQAEKWQRHVETLDPMYDDNDRSRLRRLSKLRFVDGGVLSNFPIDAFRAANPSHWLHKLPTLGFSLLSRADEGDSDERLSDRGPSMLAHLCAEMFSATRALRDREARRSTRSPSAIAFIDTGEHNWLNFMLDDDSAMDLFSRGMACVIELVSERVMRHKPQTESASRDAHDIGCREYEYVADPVEEAGTVLRGAPGPAAGSSAHQ